MIGPHLHFTFRSTHFSIGVGDLAVVAVFGWLALDVPNRDPPSSLARVVLTATVTSLFFVTGFVLDQARHAISGSIDRIGPVLLSTFGAMCLTRGEVTDESKAVRAGRNGMLVDLATAAGFLVLALGAYDRDGPISRAVFVAAALVVGMCMVRTCPVQGLDGGIVARWYMSIVFDDEDGATQATNGISIGLSLMFTLSGFLVLAQPGHWNIWGLPMMLVGLDCAALSQWVNRRTQWVRAASTKRVDELGQSRLPTIKQSAPISELLAIFAVEGQRAMVVVTDERGRPAGVIELRQLRAAVHAKAAAHPDEMMVTLSRVPQIERETSVLDAALYLERTGQLAMVVEVAKGKQRVISLDELLRITD